ncbi:hypothetical protein FACS1894170_01400 [Planctomycetales bacterium]|nr:hypothetical protein FACS1894170_01400 [Planctomycetales bacterium]
MWKQAKEKMQAMTAILYAGLLTCSPSCGTFDCYDVYEDIVAKDTRFGGESSRDESGVS